MDSHERKSVAARLAQIDRELKTIRKDDLAVRELVERCGRLIEEKEQLERAMAARNVESV